MRGRHTVLLWVVGIFAAAFSIAPLAAFAYSAFAGTGKLAEGKTLPLLLALVSPSTISALRFSLVQATLSTVLALLVGFPGAFFVARYDFRGRRFFMALAAVPFCLPAILVILSFILYYGKNGYFSLMLARLGFVPKGEGLLYSMWGLVFVHAFYNFPIVIQNVGSVWAKLSRSREDAARTLGAGKVKSFAAGTLPYLLPSMLQSASLIFLFCFFSFTIVLVFGGLAGSTLEVGIYRAIRFTNDRPKALALALIQTSIALAIVAAFAYFDRKNAEASKDFGNPPPRRHPRFFSSLAIGAYSGLIALFFLGPLFALTAEAFTVRQSLAGESRFGLENFARLLTGPGAPLLRAAGSSLMLSGLAAFAAVILGFSIAASSHYGLRHGQGAKTRWFVIPLDSWITALPLALSPAVITAGWSALMNSSGDLLIVIGQMAIAWPFVARSLSAAFSSLDKKRNEAARTLGSSPLHAMVWIDAGLIAPSIASSAAFAFSITMGDANIPLMLGGGKRETLPLLLYRLTSSYRFSEACAVGIVLALFTSVAFFLKERNHETS